MDNLKKLIDDLLKLHLQSPFPADQYSAIKKEINCNFKIHFRKYANGQSVAVIRMDKTGKGGVKLVFEGKIVSFDYMTEEYKIKVGSTEEVTVKQDKITDITFGIKKGKVRINGTSKDNGEIKFIYRSNKEGNTFFKEILIQWPNTDLEWIPEDQLEVMPKIEPAPEPEKVLAMDDTVIYTIKEEGKKDIFEAAKITAVNDDQSYNIEFLNGDPGKKTIKPNVSKNDLKKQDFKEINKIYSYTIKKGGETYTDRIKSISIFIPKGKTEFAISYKFVCQEKADKSFIPHYAIKDI
jgi:hypothetical protein